MSWSITEEKKGKENCRPATWRRQAPSYKSIPVGAFSSYGGEPFVLLFDPIIFGSPAGKKEIDVLFNH